jgi:hydrogenase expression/formation protein HypE
MPEDTILIGHGAGGKLSRDLINSIFLKHFSNKNLSKLDDSSLINTSEKSAFTTDSYVIDPILFPGGDIGKLAVSGTVNDLLVGGSVPQFLSAGFIIEEGLPVKTLDTIVASMAREARKANVQIVTGDTKVVKKGQCDKLFINTAGIGKGMKLASHLWEKPAIKPGDKIIASGYLGDHAIAILAARNNISFEKELLSDVAPLNNLIIPLIEDYSTSIKFMRDITRGGLATILNEICENQSFGIKLLEDNIPIKSEVAGICEVFGFDPLYLANEGKVMLIAEEKAADAILEKMKSTTLGTDAAIVGEITKDGTGRVRLESVIGGSRIVDMLSGEMLPRIC